MREATPVVKLTKESLGVFFLWFEIKCKLSKSDASRIVYDRQKHCVLDSGIISYYKALGKNRITLNVIAVG